VRSIDLDKWTHDQLKVMTLGGNDNARHFFAEKGWNFSSTGSSASAMVTEKYTSRAAKLYRAHLTRLANGGQQHENSFGSDFGDALKDDDGGEGLQTQWTTAAQSKAAMAAVEAEAAEAKARTLISVPEASSDRLVAHHNTLPSSSSSSAAISSPNKSDKLDVSCITGSSGPSTSTGGVGGSNPSSSLSSSSDPFGGWGEIEAPSTTGSRPKLIGTSIGIKSSGSGKLGAKKLGATKLSTSSGAVDWDKVDETPIPLQVVAPAAVSVASLTRSLGQVDVSGGRSSSSSSSSSSASEDFSKFKNAKSISSSMLFDKPTDDQAKSDKARLAMYSSARGISSDAFFGDGSPGQSSGGGGGGGGGRFGTRADSAGEGLADFIDKLGSAVSDDFKKVTEIAKEKARAAREGLSQIADSLR
jgi:hypothetical protein